MLPSVPVVEVRQFYPPSPLRDYGSATIRARIQEVGMSTNRFVLATVAGGIVLFLVGGLIYAVLAASFFEANQGSAVGVMRESPDFVHLALGQLVYGALLTVVIGKWAGQSGAAAGLRLGAVFGALLGFAMDLTMFGVTNISNITATLVDPFFVMIQMGTGGAVVGLVLEKVK
jgi:hypothetical protein